MKDEDKYGAGAAGGIGAEGQIQSLTHRGENQAERNLIQEDLINNEIDAICNRTLENYIEP